jgi:hypothetical protein
MVVETFFHPREPGASSAPVTRPIRTPRDGAPGLKCSVGIMAYNEEGNIANAIRAVLAQELTAGEIAELIVVASGCSDGTTDIVDSLVRDEPRLRLIVEKERAGKASAINLFIAAARCPVLMMVNADNIVRPGSIDAMLGHFHDPTVGMVGGHPVPVNGDDSFLGYAVHLVWRLHDQIARDCPKLGEIVAFRDVLPCIPTDTAVDELSMQALMTQLGYRLVYEPDAVVLNRGPTTVSDFLRQRRRIFAGHLQIAKQQGYVASTMSARRIGRAALASGQARAACEQPLWALGTVALEAAARGLGYYDFLRDRPHHIWATVTTTKGDISDGPDAAAEQNVLVFHLVDFDKDRLALGSLATRSLLRRVAQDISARLGPFATVLEQANGTIIVMLPCDRTEAEDAAHEVVRDLAAYPTDKSRGLPVQLACAVITFPKTGNALARSIPALAS